ncbi:MAG TPA: DNA-directed RNA polymerase subunit A', partial [archaeon]|nr:DNA-directed RNA polymerase subunit A' [archaeon]
GKRVNFSARTVISPDPRISINEVGVPAVIAKELTVAEHVTELNSKRMKELIKDNKVNYVLRPDGRRIKITEDNKNDLVENLAAGWIVERQLQDGDISLFNRQPSLHRMSIMAHRIKIMPFRTFRLAPQVCPPYNADFDGDEMNLHIPQTEEARIEAANLMDVQKHIFSPKFGGPVIGLDLDQISGTYLLTKKGVTFTKEEAVQLLASAGIDLELPDKKEFTGKEVLSLILPKTLNIEFKGNTYDIDKEEGYVIIKNGEIKSGVLDAKAVGAFKGRILNKIRELEGEEAVRLFIDKCARLAVAYLMKRGFSIGISDIDLPQRVNEHIREEIKEAQKEADKLIGDFGKDKLKGLPGMTMQQSLEAQILNALAVGLNNISEIVAKNIKQSDILNMARAGAKGSLINTTQMSACVGQESILGQRIKRGYTDRTLPHFKRGDLSAESHGYVARGFKQGLTPFEVFWNIMNGREGLMDKSLRTRKSGYMQRRLVNALQDLKIEKDYSVRNSTGTIVQFLAGEDGIDPTKSSWGKLDWKL